MMVAWATLADNRSQPIDLRLERRQLQRHHPKARRQREVEPVTWQQRQATLGTPLLARAFGPVSVERFLIPLGRAELGSLLRAAAVRSRVAPVQRLQ